MTKKIRNWTKFQHFKDRRPPWVKLYREILDDPDWHELDGDSAKILVGLWLLASEDEKMEGNLPDTRKIAFRLRTTEAKINQALNKLILWFDHDDINAISGEDSEEPEQGEKESNTRAPKASSQSKNKTLPKSPDGVSNTTWESFLVLRKAKKAPVTESAMEGIIREANKANWSLEQALGECCTRGWAGFKAEWVADKSQPNKPNNHTGFANKDYQSGATDPETLEWLK